MTSLAANGCTPNLGNIEEISDLRTIWPNEATDFTPWLTEHIYLVSDAIGVPLEVAEEESSVGSFRVDILCRSAAEDEDELAIIENQLEATNHDHLGKLLTYAAGKRAKYVIWVVKEAREEHRAAIEWLNESNAGNAQYFLLELHLYRIDGSAPAPMLTVVEQPNRWMPTVAPADPPSKGYKYDFWSAFNDYIFKANPDFASAFSKHKPTGNHWYSLYFGSSSVHLNLLANTKEEKIAVELNIHDGSSMFSRLYQHRQTIEVVVGCPLDWRELPGKKTSRVLIELSANPKDAAADNQQFDWLAKYALLFREAFSPYL